MTGPQPWFRALAVFFLFFEGFWTFVRIFFLHSPWKHNLPLHISDFSLFCLLLALWFQSRIFCLLTVLVGAPVAFLAMVFPSISEMGVWRFVAFFHFYVMHLGILIGGIWFFWHGLRPFPRFSEWLGLYAITLGYGIFLIPINSALGSNYFFTHYPPKSLPLDLHNLPWNVYFPSACCFFFFFFLLWWFFLKRISEMR